MAKAICVTCEQEYGELGDHSGGAATCEEKATCENCHTEYGSALGHNYGEWISNGNNQHIKTCANDSSHVITENCSGGTATCLAKAICATCEQEYGELGDHSGGTATCTEKATCENCHTEYGSALGHNYGEWESNGNNQHVKTCANDSSHVITENCSGGTATCLAKAICATCEQEYGELVKCNFVDDICTACGQDYYTEGIYFELINGDTAYKVGGNGSATGDLIIPSIYKGKPVTTIGQHSFWCSGVRSIKLGDNVTTIDKNAFAYCNDLRKIFINKKVTSVGYWATYGCEDLTIYCEIESQPTSWHEDWNHWDLVTGYQPKVHWGATYQQFLCDHAYSNYVYNEDATCTKNGTSTSYCDNGCGLTKTVTANNTQLSHVYTQYIYDENATCVKNGTKTAYCDYGCGAKSTIMDTESVGGHNFVNYVYNKDAQYQVDGTKTAICEHGCGEKDTITAEGTALDYLLKYELKGEEYTVTGYQGTLIDLIIPATYQGKPVTSIGDSAFYQCSTILSVEIPDSVKIIGQHAFAHSGTLKSVYFGENSQLTKIEHSAFYYTGIETIKLPATVTYISTPFNGCSSLLRFEVDENNRSFKAIDGNLYTYDGKELVQYAGGKTETVFEVPSGVEKIGAWSFRANGTHLTKVVISDGVISIEADAFAYCTLLEEIKIPNSVTAISSSAFVGCTSLINIDLPNSLKFIGSDAFKDCSSLKSITIPASVSTIGIRVFEGCISLENIIVEENNEYYKDVDGNLYNIDGTTLIQYAAGKKDTSFIVPDSVTRIDDSAFSDDASLTSIIIADSVIDIGDGAFNNCNSLTDIVIPNNVKSIGKAAFFDCYSLTSIVIPHSVVSMGSHMFGNCNLLTIYCEASEKPSGWDNNWNSSCPVVWNCNNNDVANDGYIYQVIDGIRYSLKDGEAIVVRQPINISGDITIPSSVTYKGNTYNVTSIAESAFYNCSSLTSIEIPNSVTNIGSSAFRNFSLLTNVTIGNSVISIGSYAFYNCSALTSIEIPNSVTSIGDYAFYGCDLLTLFCEVDKKPSGWSSAWKEYKCPVYWAGEWSLVDGVPTPNA